jgi:hypothetical protein
LHSRTVNPKTIPIGCFRHWHGLYRLFLDGIQLSFADGHSERRQWEAGGTLRPAVQGGGGGTIDALPPTDFEWMRQRTSVKRD